MRGPSQIPPMQVPLIQARSSQREAMQQAMQQAIHQLAVGMSSQLAISHIASRDNHQDVDVAQIRRFARDSRTAAVAIFEGLGVIEVQDAS